MTGNNRTKTSLIGLEGVVKKAVGLGGWHWLRLSPGAECRLQRNALAVVAHPTGLELESSEDEDEEEEEDAARRKRADLRAGAAVPRGPTAPASRTPGTPRPNPARSARKARVAPAREPVRAGRGRGPGRDRIAAVGSAAARKGEDERGFSSSSARR